MESKITANNINISIKQEQVLIHGIFASKEIMNPLYNHYKSTHHVVSYDVRGHGKSDKPESFDLDDYAMI